ncbi:Uncharacterised protein [Enterobacter hormaechei]|uniref:hypothetical protein n=1 Tax=Enterobacter hormaechei TaxID=158836 RepID=UPI00079B3094|nr:hypothetical protein [Enterobacter hormaechei]ELT6675892.1 hypothetical protein [Enterobacter hormaechei]MCU2847992.1 hypothetical protein [Enterobacter hormaechei subsp. steigerwaltii]SAG24946.1 Uncharacterised protein [Enterobacter hormaechei]
MKWINLSSTFTSLLNYRSVAKWVLSSHGLKYQIFVNQLSRVTSESRLVARTTKAIKESEEALLLFEAESGS